MTKYERFVALSAWAEERFDLLDERVLLGEGYSVDDRIEHLENVYTTLVLSGAEERLENVPPDGFVLDGLLA